MLRYAAASLITGYQQYISPYKGFHCAHLVLHRGESCSVYGKRMVLERGIGGFLAAMRERFAACRQAAAVLRLRRVRAGAKALLNRRRAMPVAISASTTDCPSRDRDKDKSGIRWSDVLDSASCACDGTRLGIWSLRKLGAWLQSMEPTSCADFGADCACGW